MGYIDVIEPGATDTARTLWCFNLIVSYGYAPPKLEVFAKLVQTRKTRRYKWVHENSAKSPSFDPDWYYNRGKQPPVPPIEIAMMAVEQFADALRKAVNSAYATPSPARSAASPARS